jgi:hypothetical protein
MKKAVFCDMKTHFTSHRKHYFSATKPIRLTLYKILDFTAVTMKNVISDIKTQFIPHRKHITSPLRSPVKSVSAI